MVGLRIGKGNYAYSATRAKAKKSQLLKEEDYMKMLQMSVPEISRYISETGYSKEMVDLADRKSGIDLVEEATYACMAKSFKSMLVGSQGELHSLISAYLEKWDNWNMKAILRGKSYGLADDKIKDDLVVAGSLSADELDRMIALGSIDDILVEFTKLTKIEFPAEVIATYKSTGNLGRIGDHLDKVQYQRLLHSIKQNSNAAKIFVSYVRTEVDMRNLETILKLKYEEVPAETIMEFIIPGGKDIDERAAQQYAEAESVSAILANLNQVSFVEDIRETLEAPDTNIRTLVLAFRKLHMQEAKKFSKLYPLSVLPVIDYMICMENETRNIRTIARGIESGLDKDVIKNLLVI